MESVYESLDPILKIIQYGSSFGSWACEQAGLPEQSVCSLDRVSVLSYRVRSFVGVISVVDEFIYLADCYNKAVVEHERVAWLKNLLSMAEVICDLASMFCDLWALMVTLALKSIAVQTVGKRWLFLRVVMFRCRTLLEQASDVWWTLSLSFALSKVLIRLWLIQQRIRHHQKSASVVAAAAYPAAPNNQRRQVQPPPQPQLALQHDIHMAPAANIAGAVDNNIINNNDGINNNDAHGVAHPYRPFDRASALLNQKRYELFLRGLKCLLDMAAAYSGASCCRLEGATGIAAVISTLL